MFNKYPLKPFSLHLEKEDRTCLGDKNLGLAIFETIVFVKSHDAIRYTVDLSIPNLSLKLLEEPVLCSFISNYKGKLVIGGYEEDIPELFYEIIPREMVLVVLPPSTLDHEIFYPNDNGKVFYTSRGSLRCFDVDALTDEDLTKLPLRGTFSMVANKDKVYFYAPDKMMRWHLIKRNWKELEPFHRFKIGSPPVVGTDANYTQIIFGGDTKYLSSITIHTAGGNYWRSIAPTRGLEVGGCGTMKWIDYENNNYLILLTEFRGLQLFSVNFF